jgi:hypothetical protein
MRNSLLAAASIAAVLMLGASADKAAAMMGASPAQLGLTNPDNGVVQKAALVCGRWGCRRVWARHWARSWARPWARPWIGPRVGWGGGGVWMGSRPLYAFAGPSVGVGWGNPGWGNPGWGFGGGGPGWGWGGASFALSSPSWGWGGGGWGGGWGRPWGWNRW